MFSKSQLFNLTSILFAVLASGEVVKLTEETFDKFIAENPLTLVKFFAPWCGHCKTLAPQYEEASDKVPEGVKLAEVDVTEEEKLGTRFEIRGFPTMKFFRTGEPEDYTGGRTSDTIVEWIEAMTSDPVTVAQSLEDAKAKFPKTTLVVGTCQKDSTEEQNFKKLAGANRMLGKFIVIEGDTPSLKLHRDFAEEPVELDITKAPEEIVKTIKSERLPYFGPVNGENFSTYMETNLDFVWFAGTEDDMNKVKDEVVIAGKEFRGKYNFVWLDTVQFEKQADGMLGVSTFPAMVRTLNGPGRFIMPGEYKAENMKQWIEDMENDKIKPTLKSEEIPVTNDEPVKIVVGKQFKEIVVDDKDVLLEIYAPWCGHCKKLEPIYTEVATKLKDLAPEVVIAKIDGTANEIEQEGYEFQGFPSLYWKKAGEKPVSYQGGRELEDIMKFLAENGTKKFEWAETPKEEAKDEL